MTSLCPWCQAPREDGPDCPRCGANYAKAESIKKHGRAVVAPPPAEAPVEAAAIQDSPLVGFEEGDIDDHGLELKFCIGALPAMFIVALAFHSFDMGRFLQRNFLGMPVHELGHAIAAWFSGFAAVPTVWKTLTADSRGVITPLLLFGVLSYLIFLAWRAEKYVLVALGGVLVVAQLYCTFGIGEGKAETFMVFSGDGLGMVVAVMLIASFFFGKGTQVYKGSLRWGFLAIGTAAYVDMFATWVAAKRDITRIPFGEQEGGLRSDAVRLVDDAGWTADEVVNRYFALGLCCLVAILAVWAWGVWSAHQTKIRAQASRESPVTR